MDKKPSQTELLYKLLSDGQPHRTDQIQSSVYGGKHLGLARVGARVFDVKKKYQVQIEGWHDAENPSLFWYQMNVVRIDISERLYRYFSNWKLKDPKKMIEISEVVKQARENGYQALEIYSALDSLMKRNVIKCDKGKCKYAF
jgi:hypothetical protein